MLTCLHKISFKLLFTAVLFIAITGAAFSSSFNSGKTKKKHTNKSSLSFSMHNKSLNMSLSNGFYFKGSYGFTSNLKTDMVINTHSLYFQKGNSIYVLPVKQKVVVLGKFKSPEKFIYWLVFRHLLKFHLSVAGSRQVKQSCLYGTCANGIRLIQYFHSSYLSFIFERKSFQLHR